VVLRLPEYSSGVSARDQQGYSDPSTMATRPSISSGSSGTNSSSASAMISSRSLIALEIVDWSTNSSSAIDQLLCDVGAEVHDDGFDRLVQRQFPWPASSVIPNDPLLDTLNEFVELLGGESRSSLTWQWSLRV
jgi:hypothetical protein